MPRRSGTISDRAPGLLLAAPASSSGKTTAAVGLARALARSGDRVATFKVGPDYIDPAFLTAASGTPCRNLDPWAMRPETLRQIAEKSFAEADFVVGEGVMGLFDGAADGTGSTADIAAHLGLPVVLVVSAGGMGASAGALVRGFATHRADIAIAGVLFNSVGSSRHEAMLRNAVAPLGVPVLGTLPRDAAIALPSRHLGLVQAMEHAGLDDVIEKAADLITTHTDIMGLRRIARPLECASGTAAGPTLMAPIGQRIAIAHDAAFAFSYPALLEAWQAAGAEVMPFSPLAGEGPDTSSDAIYLPGGYPELHAGTIAANDSFMTGLRQAAAHGTVILGECGGYMTLGGGMVDGRGECHAMAGLLPLETSFAERRLSLGYRQASLVEDGPLGAVGTRLRGHEFHYATIVDEGDAAPLFQISDASGTSLGNAGRRAGGVMGSFVHLIDTARG